MNTVLADFTEVTSLVIEQWDDPLVEQLGHPARSPYVERYWLPILGPSSIVLLRHLSLCELGMEHDLSELSQRMGMTANVGGRHAPIRRTISRLCNFGAARPGGYGRLQVRSYLPPLPQRYHVRLPEALVQELTGG